MPLEEYRAKRDFTHTPEPAGGGAAEDAPVLRFVVQKHAARALHYDFRLELDGVLMSWAIPKGPSLDSHDKRLAVHVEDHPIEYGTFEGTIPAGEYGGGTVIVWDRGTWQPVGDPHAGLTKGDFKFDLFGEKLQGRWVLVRLKPRAGEKRDNWLLIKEKDSFVRPAEEFKITAELPDSVATGRSIESVAGGEQAGGVGGGGSRREASDGPDGPAPAKPSADPSGLLASASRASSKTKSARGSAKAKDLGGATESVRPSGAAEQVAGQTQMPGSGSGRPSALAQTTVPGSIGLELATLVNVPPPGDEWVAEAKYDGYRLVLVLEDGRVRALTRSGADWSDRFPGLVAAVAKLPAASAVIDGEAVVFDDAGVSRFEQLQSALGSHPERIAFAAFDLLHLNGFDLREQPLVARKELLATLLAEPGGGGGARGGAGAAQAATAASPASPLRYADHILGGGAELFATACSAGLEGVVCKRADSRYVAGRGRDWQKVKCRHTQELVVGGYTEGQGSRGDLGSLLVGYYDDARLVYAGRVGSGFDERTLSDLVALLRAAERPDSPFDPAPSISGHELHWAEPRLVIEAAFREWTKDGVLRQPVFLGVREDKAAEEVVREAALDRTDFGRPESVAGVRLTNPQKLLFPDTDFEKRALADYYEAIAPAMLAHVGNRPLTLLRCPVGHGRSCFYQRHPDAGLPRDVHTLGHVLTGHAEEDVLLWVDSAAGLVSLAQMGVLEIHTWLSRTDMPTRPDRIIFDLDPGPGLTWAQICEGARIIREEFSALSLPSYVKSTGSKGLHVMVPLEPVWEFGRIRGLCKAIVDGIVSRHPQLFVGKAAKDIRNERIFLDYLRNAEGASAVAPYSTRNLSGPSCAVPLAWDELTDDFDIRAMTPVRVLERVAAGIDPWEHLSDDTVDEKVLVAAEKTAEGSLGI